MYGGVEVYEYTGLILEPDEDESILDAVIITFRERAPGTCCHPAK